MLFTYCEKDNSLSISNRNNSALGALIYQLSTSSKSGKVPVLANLRGSTRRISELFNPIKNYLEGSRVL